VCLVAVPAVVGYPLKLLWLIDFGKLIVITGTLALTWCIVKTVLVYFTLHRAGSRPDGRWPTPQLPSCRCCR
jgi:hypothetical protein